MKEHYHKDLSHQPHGISKSPPACSHHPAFQSYPNFEDTPPPSTLARFKPFLWLLLRILFVFTLLLLLLSSAFAQNRKQTAEEADFDLLIQELFPVPEEDVDYSDLYESIFQFYQQPLDLNRATAADLKSLFILSPTQIQNFLAYRDEFGKLLSIFELQAIPTFDKSTIQKLLYFATISESSLQEDTRSLLKRIIDEENRTLLIRTSRNFPKARGYLISPSDTSSTGRPRSRYLGDPYALYVRARIAHLNDFSIGITAEKDAGEQFIFDKNTRRAGMDFYSAHAIFYEKGKFKRLAFGDYQIQAGQGLVLAGGFAVGKGSETINTIRRATTGIRPYTSVLETNFFRGAAATYQISPRLELTGFISRTRESGNLKEVLDSLGNDTSEGNVFLTSVLATGYHRTPTEIANRRIFLKTEGGGMLNYTSKSRQFEVGAAALHTYFEVPIRRNPTKYNQYEFNGQYNYNLSIFSNYNWRNFSFFGEAARSKSGGIGAVAGVVGSLAKTVEVALHLRHYDKNFHTFYGAALGEGTRNINERGIYWGLKYTPTRRWVITAYHDRFRFPWLRFLVDAPSEGYESLLRISYRPTRSIQLYFQYRQESRARNFIQNDPNLSLVLPYLRQNYQISFSYKAEKILSLASRLQFSDFSHQAPTTRGFAITQDVNFDLGRFRLATRFALFDTDDYENRQYIYEKDVLYYFYIPPYYGQGFRTYYLFQFKVHKRLDFWLKYAYNNFRNQTKISSGLAQIEGNQKHELRMQVRYKF